LPPIEDLHIAVDDSVQFKDVGKIASIVDVLGKFIGDILQLLLLLMMYCTVLHQ